MMPLLPLYPPVRLDWRKLFEDDDSGDPSVSWALHVVSAEVARGFTLCMSQQEFNFATNWAKRSQTTTGAHVEEMLNRAPLLMCDPLDLDKVVASGEFDRPVPRGLVTSPVGASSLPSSIGVTDVVVSTSFLGWDEVMSAPLRLQQVFTYADADRDEIWRRIIRPFGSAEKIRICDPYLVKKAFRNPRMKSGLAYYIQKFSSVVVGDGRPVSLEILSSQDKEWSCTQDELSDLLSEIVDRCDGRISVNIRVTRCFDKSNARVLHARYLMASQMGIETRVLVFDDSVLTEMSNSRSKLPDAQRIITMNVYAHRSQIGTFVNEWNRALKHVEFKVSASKL